MTNITAQESLLDPRRQLVRVPAVHVGSGCVSIVEAQRGEVPPGRIAARELDAAREEHQAEQQPAQQPEHDRRRRARAGSRRAARRAAPRRSRGSRSRAAGRPTGTRGTAARRRPARGRASQRDQQRWPAARGRRRAAAPRSRPATQAPCSAASLAPSQNSVGTRQTASAPSAARARARNGVRREEAVVPEQAVDLPAQREERRQVHEPERAQEEAAGPRVAQRPGAAPEKRAHRLPGRQPSIERISAAYRSTTGKTSSPPCGGSPNTTRSTSGIPVLLDALGHRGARRRW